MLLSYKTAVWTDWIGLLINLVTFSFVGRLVDPSRLPQFGGSRATYLQFVAVGIATSGFVQVALGQVMAAVRNEQLMGTLEALMMTPSAPATLQLGFVTFDMVYVPFRTSLFLVMAHFLFHLGFDLSGFGPAAAVMLALIPVVWGLGVVSAAGVLTFRRGGAVTGFAGAALTMTSGAYFPLDVLPNWLEAVARLNPVAIALGAARNALLGHAGWSGIVPTLLKLAPMAAISLLAGGLAFRLALRRERRLGTLGLY